MPFSERYGYKAPRQEIFEDAPDNMRHYFCERILRPLVYVDRDKRYRNAQNSPLGAKELVEDLNLTIGQAPQDSEYLDSWHCVDELFKFIKVVEWFHFYDIVERIGVILQTFDKSHYNGEWGAKFGFRQYLTNLNILFDQFKIGWRLEKNSELQKNTPEAFLEREQSISQKLVGKYDAAGTHLNKAIRYIRKPPLDPENAIKEIVSAVESIARIQNPKASTLGEAIKTAKKNGGPQLLLDAIEKVYAFANSEPGVRHGGRFAPNVAINDAELCLHISLAFIRYLVADSDEWKDIVRTDTEIKSDN